MATTISVALQKGGTGKTATAQALASTIGFKGKKVLLIDMDSQCDLTYASLAEDPEHTILDVLAGDCKASEALVHCKYFDILAAHPYLTNVERSENVKATLLNDSISSLKSRYDFVVIDTPPALGNCLFNSLTASDYVVIPSEPRPFALKGLGSLNQTIKSIQNGPNPNLRVLGILLIKYSNRTILNRDIKAMIEDYAKQMDTTVFNATIREGIAVAEAQTVREPLIDYAKNSKPNIDYKAFTTELLKKLGG